MIVTCPSCRTHFHDEPPPAGPPRKGRCSRCDEVFALPGPGRRYTVMRHGAETPVIMPAAAAARETHTFGMDDPTLAGRIRQTALDGQGHDHTPMTYALKVDELPAEPADVASPPDGTGNGSGAATDPAAIAFDTSSAPEVEEAGGSGPGLRFDEATRSFNLDEPPADPIDSQIPIQPPEAIALATAPAPDQSAETVWHRPREGAEAPAAQGPPPLPDPAQPAGVDPAEALAVPELRPPTGGSLTAPRARPNRLRLALLSLLAAVSAGAAAFLGADQILPRLRGYAVPEVMLDPAVLGVVSGCLALILAAGTVRWMLRRF